MPKVKGQTKISSKHQVTIPVGALREVGCGPGDVLKVEADGTGRIVLTKVEALLERYSGGVTSDGSFRATVDRVRDEWR